MFVIYLHPLVTSLHELAADSSDDVEVKGPEWLPGGQNTSRSDHGSRVHTFYEVILFTS